MFFVHFLFKSTFLWWTQIRNGWRTWYYHQWLNISKYSSTPTKKDDLAIKSHEWVWVFHICQNHAFIITIMAWYFLLKYQRCNAQKRRSVEISNCLFETYKILSYLMVIICFKNTMTWKWQQCVHVYHLIMHNNIWNMCCIVVQNFHGLILQAQNHISTIQMLALPFVFMSIKKFMLYYACQTPFQWK